MSLLNNDRKIVDEGRKNKLEDVKASLRDQVVEKLRKKLIEEGIGQKVRDLQLRGNSNRAEWLERQHEYLQSWDEHLVGDDTGKYGGSSNLHMPVPLIVTKTLHARFLQAVWGIDPPFYLKSRTEAMVDRVPLISDTMRYALYDWGNKYSGMEEVIDKWIWAWVSQGSGILKQRWECEYTKFVDVQEVEVDDTPDFTIDPATGKESLKPRKKKEEKEVEVTKKIFEGPMMDFVEVEDLLIIGGSGDPAKADVVIHQDYLDSSQLWTLVDRGVFNQEAVEHAIESGPDLVSGKVTSQLAQQRTTNAGQSQLDTENDHDRYQILEAYLKLDVDGSGIFSDVVVWVHGKSGEILKATYLRRMNKTGERPFQKIDFLIRNGQEYGVGIVELIYPLTKELDFFHNSRVDFGMIATMPFGFYRASSSLNPETIHYEPGALIPLDNPQADVYFPNLGNRTSFGFQEEQAIQQMIDRVTAISDLNLGVISGQGATRTATGTRALLGESNANLDVFLRRMNRGWKKALEFLLHMLQQRIPEGLSFRVTGDGGADYWRVIKDEADLMGDFDIEVSGNSANSNRQIQEEVANQILQITSNPLYAQLQIVTPQNVYESLKNLFVTKGVREYNRYISKPMGYQGPQLTPEEEANRLLRGMVVPVRPDADHDGFINFFNEIYENDELLGQFTEEQTVTLYVQKQKHEQMKQAMAAQQAQAAVAAQMQQNAAMSQNQAPTGLNPVATGQQQDPGQMPIQ